MRRTVFVALLALTAGTTFGAQAENMDGPVRKASESRGAQVGVEVENFKREAVPSGDVLQPTAGAADNFNACMGSGSIVYDDGSLEDGVRPATGMPSGGVVMRFDPGGDLDALNRFCVCFTATSETENSILFDFVVFDDDGPNGTPGTETDRFLAQATGVPLFPDENYYSYNLGGLNVVPPSGSFYVGVGGWDIATYGDIFVCTDETSTTPLRPAYFSNNEPTDWVFLPSELSDYRALGVRIEGAGRESVLPSGLVVPGFNVEVANPLGPTTFFAVRNNFPMDLNIRVDYYGDQVTGVPLRRDTFNLGAKQTLTQNIRNDLTDLLVTNGFATGLAVITEATGSINNLVGDFFQLDAGNAFASGDRLVSPDDLCVEQEMRFVDFGSGTELQILLSDPPDDLTTPAFFYSVYTQAGTLIAGFDYFTTDNLNVIDIGDLIVGQNFGTVEFDFADSGKGFVSAKYSAFGQFSVGLKGACLDP